MNDRLRYGLPIVVTSRTIDRREIHAQPIEEIAFPFSEIKNQQEHLHVKCVPSRAGYAFRFFTLNVTGRFIMPVTSAQETLLLAICRWQLTTHH